MLPDLPDPHAIFSLGPLPARLLAGGAGLVLLLAGSRAYRAAVVLPGVLLGAGGALVAAHALHLAPGPTLAGAAVAGLVGGFVAHAVERLALRVVGVVLGLGAVQVVGPLVATGAVPWWAWPVAAVAGALVAPLAWSAALVPITAFLGACVIVDAAGMPSHPAVVLGLAVAGVFAQVATGRPRDEGRAEPRTSGR